jgi:hypothetical protein
MLRLKKESAMTILKMIVIVFILSAFSASCATTHESETGGEKDMSVTGDWKDWRQPPPWSRR